MTALKTHIFLAAFLLTGIFIGVAKSQDTAGEISEREIVSLQKELAEAGEVSSKTRMRRAYKSVVRDGEKLWKSSRGAPKRYRV